ncbi:MAG: helix-turn-helix domain-containing protein [Clostridium perfringens]|uniref:helix-turn-helix domain-containing protein n=1 Tax=Clostridium perfringens TaxID=1502 RepID=UPI0023BA1D1B|nr:helix-turn-helix domain-containing protein [Clostridium perfringens]MDK0837617.1 helix-turn-helix domain-containing protein [Clostridium perfringens]MDM0995138.1 helix-turn-helix domain-containing protein [Clostridium perfringens]MDU6260325.1 helix-turn-helix domain-containing protein [Clostridium perfringens]MDU6895236.1 helix-turn-helix domain-containing protein [Clostridium perfringens]MDU6932537.1 helix-turn-helix domain-containing protein [Clostridium perfringens]
MSTVGRGKKYKEDYKEMISDLYKSGMTISEISSEYGIAKSTVNVWIKANKEIKIYEDEVITLKEVAKLKKEIARIKEENEIL